MAMNGLAKIALVLATGANEIHLDPALGERARRPILRLLEFAEVLKTEVLGNNDA
jgi:quinolinate synthase